MSDRVVRWAAWAVGILAAVLTVANVVLIVLARHELDTPEADLLFNVVGAAAGLLYPAIGLLIAVRARNAIGWILAGIGIGYALVDLGGLYAAVGLLTYPGSLPAAEVIATVLGEVWIFAFSSVAFVLLLFPDGRPPSPRWRPILWIGMVGIVASYAGFLLKPRPIEPIAGLAFPNPIAIERFGDLVGSALVVTSWLTVIAAVACFVGLIQRFRAGDAELRQQIKWLGLVAALGVVCILTAFAGLFACKCDNAPVAVVGFTALVFVIVFGVPAAIAVALMKYRLYDLDIVVSKALVYGLLAALFTAVYVAVVIGVGTVVGDRGSPFLTTLAAVAIAVTFQPVRERVRHLANRMVYGKRATPYEVLAEFSDRLATTYAPEDVLPRMAQILATGTGAASARVWLRSGEELRAAASWPENGTAPPVPIAGDTADRFPEGEHGMEVRHQGDLLGALTVTMPPNDPMNPSKAKLVRDLASQAGLVLRNVGLIEELRASRRRIVTAQDARAKQLERNLHDGAQQELVALGVQLGLAHRLAARDAPGIAEMLDRLRGQATGALENLRDLARGIYPPLLADKGLVVALEAQARKAALPVEVEHDGIDRYAQEVEAAVYFCVLEALQNVAKYADATSARLRLSEKNGTLTFSVVDDGKGFDPGTTPLGTGLQGMKDRLEALGGSLTVASSPGSGTTVTGAILARTAIPA